MTDTITPEKYLFYDVELHATAMTLILAGKYDAASHRCRVTSFLCGFQMSSYKKKRSGTGTYGAPQHASPPSHPRIQHRRSPGRIAFTSKLRCQPRNRQQQPVNRHCRHGGCPLRRRRGCGRLSREQQKVHAQHLQALTMTPHTFCGGRPQRRILSPTPPIRSRTRFTPTSQLAQLASTILLPPHMPRRWRVWLVAVITGMNQLGHDIRLRKKAQA